MPCKLYQGTLKDEYGLKTDSIQSKYNILVIHLSNVLKILLKRLRQGQLLNHCSPY